MTDPKHDFLKLTNHPHQEDAVFTKGPAMSKGECHDLVKELDQHKTNKFPTLPYVMLKQCVAAQHQQRKEEDQSRTFSKFPLFKWSDLSRVKAARCEHHFLPPNQEETFIEGFNTTVVPRWPDLSTRQELTHWEKLKLLDIKHGHHTFGAVFGAAGGVFGGLGAAGVAIVAPHAFPALSLFSGLTVGRVALFSGFSTYCATSSYFHQFQLQHLAWLTDDSYNQSPLIKEICPPSVMYYEDALKKGIVTDPSSLTFPVAQSIVKLAKSCQRMETNSKRAPFKERTMKDPLAASLPALEPMTVDQWIAGFPFSQILAIYEEPPDSNNEREKTF